MVTLDEAASILGVTVEQVRVMIDEGLLVTLEGTASGRLLRAEVLGVAELGD